MSENTQTVAARARKFAESAVRNEPGKEQHWLKFRLAAVTGCQCGAGADESDSGFGDSIATHLIEVGATFAATITPEQVEAAAREIQNIERNAGNVAGIEWCRRRVHAIFAAAGFQIGADS